MGNLAADFRSVAISSSCGRFSILRFFIGTQACIKKLPLLDEIATDRKSATRFSIDYFRLCADQSRPYTQTIVLKNRPKIGIYGKCLHIPPNMGCPCGVALPGGQAAQHAGPDGVVVKGCFAILWFTSPYILPNVVPLTLCPSTDDKPPPVEHNRKPSSLEEG